MIFHNFLGFPEKGKCFFSAAKIRIFRQILSRAQNLSKNTHSGAAVKKHLPFSVLKSLKNP